MTYEGTCWNTPEENDRRAASLRRQNDEHEAKRKAARDAAIADIILFVCVLLAGILIGWRLHYLMTDYPVRPTTTQETK